MAEPHSLLSSSHLHEHLRRLSELLSFSFYILKPASNLTFLSSLETFLLFTTTPYNPLPIHVMSRFRGVNIDCPLTSLHLSMSFLLPPTFAFIPIRFFLPLLGFILGYFHIFFYFLFYFLPSLNDKVFGFSLRLFGDCTIDIRFRFSSLVIRSMTPGS